ncbi:response regulator transcription factor [Psychroflexus maritimus]|uniref:Response regulator n=1 Tax=Psychroflexus maritimus TaxID=2714865 RepID=A0A967AI47_9FLAO|nr:response regulator [Psychroflexus maritimus]NGZ90901.1 response regulator [Psychroflexus maritimus]
MKKILIVDDEPNIIMALEYALKKKSYLVYIARDGDEAIRLADENLPDLVVLDIMMPKVDGYEVLRHLKSESPIKDSIKVVFISAKNKEDDIEQGLSLGADNYLTKPFSIKKLLNEIETQLEN